MTVRGFETPSRKFDVLSTEVRDAVKKIGLADDGMPSFYPIPAHQHLAAD